jgi:hypothetical protein
MIRRAAARYLFVVLAFVLAVGTAAYAQSLDKSLESKPYAEGEAGTSASSDASADPVDKGYLEGAGGLTGRSVGGAAGREWPEGGAGRSGTASLKGTTLQEWLEETVDADLPLLYTFAGVTDDGEQGSADRKEATSIHCTNLDTENAQVEVQVYQWNGTDVFTGTVNMPPNRSFTFSTQNTAIYFDDVLLGGSPGTPAIFQGSGRVLSASPRVICTAQVLDPLGYPPMFVSALELFRE